jgi:predicted phage gp36 major capsid-like protein
MKAAAEQAEIDRIAAEEKAKADAIQAAEDARLREIARQNAERERVAAEEAARMADVEHRRAINAAALQALVKSGLDEQSAKLVVMAIVVGNVPGVSIKY